MTCGASDIADSRRVPQKAMPMRNARPLRKQDTALRVMPFGDSNTWGTGNPDTTGGPASTVGYRLALKSALSNSGIDIAFVGSFPAGQAVFDDCQTEAWPGKGINTLIWRVREGILERYEPDVVLLLIGANNMWRSLEDRRPIGPLVALYWVWRLQRLLGEMRRRRPQAYILVGKPVTPGNAHVPLTIYRAGIGVLVALYRVLGARMCAVDLKADNDGVHYTPAGHAQVAALWCAAIHRLHGR
jgi:lysophospholipase L1-like esterase